MSDWSGYDESGVGSADPDAQAQALHDMWQKFGDTWLGKLAKSTLAPGRAVTGQYETTPATPGVLTDEDEARSQLNNRTMYDQAGDLANLAVVSGMPKVALEGVSGMAKKPVFGSMAGAGAADQMHLPGIPEPPVPPTPPPGTNPGGLYSAVGRAVENAPKSTRTAEEWGGWLRNQPGIKADELTSLGLNPDAINPGLRGQKLDKDTLLGHVRANTPKFNETVLGDTPGVTVDQLQKEYPNAYATLRAHGVEPEISPEGSALGFHHAATGDILGWDDFEGWDLPQEAQDAAERMDDLFHQLLREDGGKGAAQYPDYTGLPGQHGGTDPAYRERLMQLERKPRGEIEPDDLAVQKYQKSWDDLTAKIRAAQERVNQTRRDNSPDFMYAVEDHRKLDNLRDQIHDRMIDDTWQRKPYWQNQGMQHGGDEIAQRAQELGQSGDAAPGASYNYDYAARAQMAPHRGASYNYDAPHFGGHNEDLLFHVRDTDGHIGGTDLPSVEKRLVQATHGNVFDDPEYIDEIAQMRYENGQDGPGMTDPYWQDLPDAEKQRFREYAIQDLHEDYAGDLASGAPDAAVRKGLITPEEAADISRHKGWQNEYLDKPGTQTTKTHHVEEFQSDWLQKARDHGYQLPPEPKPEPKPDLNGMLDKLGWKMEEVPNYVPPETKRALDQKITLGLHDVGSFDELAQRNYANYGRARAEHLDKPDTPPWEQLPDEDKARWQRGAEHDAHAEHYKDSAADEALAKGKITPEEAEQWKHAKANPKPYKLTFNDTGGSEFYNSRPELEAAIKATYEAQPRPGYNANIPDAPFKGKWQELAMKKAVLDAVAKGKDAVSWWPGEVHGQRYGFEQHVNELRYDPANGRLQVLPKNSARWQTHTVKPEDLADYVGREHAEKLTAPIENARPDLFAVNSEYSQWLTQHRLPRMSMDELEMEMAPHVHNMKREGYTADTDPDIKRFEELKAFQRRFYAADERNGQDAVSYNSLKGDQLRMTTKEGQGQRGFYNDILPRTANSLFKKYGAKVERATVATHHGTGEAHVLKITPKLREAVQNEGLPLFQAGVPLPHILNDGRDDNGQ